ncbi:MAG: tetratricopeptide repeat protein [Elusimicrobiaceae bacterium]|nr:tetratricopeptide repeat protein [Elusimicrobiaceae bacterium]
MKKLLIFVLFTIFTGSFLCAQSCLEKSRKFFNSKDYISAEHALEKCSKKEQASAEVQISMGGIKFLLAKYDEAEKYFNAALKTLPKNSPYFAYVYSSLGDIAVQKKQITKANDYYQKSLKYQPKDINALVGYGYTLEKTNKKDLAAKYYKQALDINFSNINARQGLIRLEPDCLSEKEKLEALKDRNIIAPEAETFTDEDIAMLREILKAERGSSVDYLYLKFGALLPEGSIFERNPNTFYARKMLTLSGYNLLIGNLSNEAKDFFSSKGVIVSDLFSLTDFNGKPIFDENGLLTEEGLIAYNRSLKGKKSYLLPGEKAPVTKEKENELVKQYLAQGYSEVTRLEFQYVEKETNCSEETLVKSLKCRIVGTGRERRYFVLSREDTGIPFSIPYELVENYREFHDKNDKDNAPLYTSTFGEKQRGPLSLCNDKGELAGL